MTRIAVIGPHLDDHVFSVGEHMLSRPEVEFTLITLAGNIPYFEPHRAKYETLMAEHQNVVLKMGWRAVNGGFLDDAVPPSRDHLPMSVENVEWWLCLALQEGFDQVWAPFGIRHPDHRVVAEACRNIADRSWRWYEELPYRVDSPEEAMTHLGRLLDQFGRMEKYGYDPTMLDAKRRLCNMYHSQIGPDVERSLYVHERLWAPT